MTLELRNRFQLHLNITVSGSSVSGVSVPPDGSEMVHQVVKSIRALDGNDLKERLVSSLVNGITKDL